MPFTNVFKNVPIINAITAANPPTKNISIPPTNQCLSENTVRADPMKKSANPVNIIAHLNAFDAPVPFKNK